MKFTILLLFPISIFAQNIKIELSSSCNEAGFNSFVIWNYVTIEKGKNMSFIHYSIYSNQHDSTFFSKETYKTKKTIKLSTTSTLRKQNFIDKFVFMDNEIIIIYEDKSKKNILINKFLK